MRQHGSKPVHSQTRGESPVKEGIMEVYRVRTLAQDKEYTNWREAREACEAYRARNAPYILEQKGPCGWIRLESTFPRTW